MRKILKNTVLPVVIALMLVVPVYADKPETSAVKTSAAQVDPMQQIMEKYMVPGPEHGRLKKFVGTWEAHAKMWMTPGQPPTESVGEMVSRLILGGRYLYSEYNATFMGKPFKGIGITGFDRFKKQYVSIWMDDMSTAIYHLSGKYDADSKVAEETGVWDDVVTGEQTAVRSVTTILSDNTYRADMYATGADGKEFKTMEILYTRKK